MTPQLKKGLIQRIPGGWFTTDGGIVDTSGISNLLRRQVRRAVVFENKNQPLSKSSSTFAYLFGVEEPTDSQNSMEGPALARVFDSALYPAVIKNLTDGATQLAVLENVAVHDNAYFGISAYTLDRLVIVSNVLSEEFIAAFHDPAVRGHLDARWPDNYPLGMSTFDANLLCVYNGWKVERIRPLLLALFGP